MNRIKKYVLLISLMIATVSSAFFFVVNADATKTDLIIARDQVESIIFTQDNSPIGDPHYEEASYQAFIDIINGHGGVIGIQAVIDDPLALQVDVDALTIDINNAIAGLILNDTYYSTLANYSQAKAANLSAYTSTSQTLYHDELDRIKDILDDPTAGETAVLALNDDIDNVDTLLVLRGDKTAITDKKAQIEVIYSTDGLAYIPSTFNAFKDYYDNIDTLLVNDLGLTLQEVIDDIDALVDEVNQVEIRLDETLNLLVLLPDKQDLINDYEDAINIDEALYTSSTFAQFSSGLVPIKQIIDDVESTEAMVNQAVLDLAELYTLLVHRADVLDLLNAYATALAIDLSLYTPNSALLYQNELSRILDIINSDNTDQAMADQALIDLNNADNLLVLQADRSELEILKELIIRAYYEEKYLYTSSSYIAYKTAVDSFGSYMYINSVISNDNVTQAVVDALELQINNALDELVVLENNSELLSFYQQLKTRDLSNFTMISKIAYNVELNRLYDLIWSTDLDSALYSQIMIDLTGVPDLLVELPDYTQLQATYESTTVYREGDYSVSSYAAFEQAKAHALYTLSNPNATQDEVNSANGLLLSSIQNLTQKQEKIYILENEELDIKPYVTLGISTILSYSVEDNSVVSIDNQGVIQGLQYGQTKVYILLSNGATEILDIFVKAKLNTTVYVLTFSVPVLGVGIGFGLTYLQKDSWMNFFKFFKNIFKKKNQK